MVEILCSLMERHIVHSHALIPQHTSHPTPPATGDEAPGTGAYCVSGNGRVLSMQLPIAVEELIPILIAVLVLGSGQKVLCHCDNQVVVAAIRSRTSGQPQITHLHKMLILCRSVI